MQHQQESWVDSLVQMRLQAEEQVAEVTRLRSDVADLSSPRKKGFISDEFRRVILKETNEELRLQHPV